MLGFKVWNIGGSRAEEIGQNTEEFVQQKKKVVIGLDDILLLLLEFRYIYTCKLQTILVSGKAYLD